MTTNTVKNNTKSLSVVMWVMLLVVGLGGVAVAWGLQLMRGMGVTGLNQQVVWGVYIAGFFIAMGAGAFLLLMAGVSEFSEVFLPLAYRKKAILLALSSIVIGGVFITMDVGAPINLWRIVTAGRFSSMMTWDFFALMLTGILALIYLFVSWKEETSTNTTKTVGVFTMIGSVALVVVEGWMLAIMAAHPLWKGGLTVLSFVLIGFTSGIAIAMIAWPELISKLKSWLQISLWVGLALVFAEVLTSMLESSVRPYPEISLSLSGSASPMFWLYLLAGVLVPLGILIVQESPNWLRVAAALAFLGAFVEKLWLLSAGQALPWLDIPQEAYFPAWIEYLGILGCIALGILIYQGLLRILKVD